MDLQGKSVRLRLIEADDAAFVLKLRLDERYNQFLSSVNPSVEAQRLWIEGYKDDERAGRQFYFIIERHDGTPCGTVRIYDLREDSFCWGSWILNGDKTRYAALESAFLIYQIGFQHLGYHKAHFDVRKGNESVISFHEKMGALRTGEDEDNLYFEISEAAVLQFREHLLKKLMDEADK